jgi:predicted GNAT family N-acyltransferase
MSKTSGGNLQLLSERYGGKWWPEIAALRLEVFVNEQNVPVELELDDLDAGAQHLAAIDGGCLVGTLRIISLGDLIKVGRVAVDKAHRGKGVGASMMEWAMDWGRRNGFAKILVEAQVQVIPFYEKLSFTAFGGEFPDAGIMHRKMERDL